MKRTLIVLLSCAALGTRFISGSPSAIAACSLTFGKVTQPGNPMANIQDNGHNAFRSNSGLATSLDNSDQSTTNNSGAQVVWSVGDRSANQAAQTNNNKVYLWAHDVRDGSLAYRFALPAAQLDVDPNVSGEHVTSAEVEYAGQTSHAVPDIEALQIQYNSSGPDTLWLFDTGDNNPSGSFARAHVNIYSTPEPQGIYANDPKLNKANPNGTISTLSRTSVTFPGGVSHNVEAAIYDELTGNIYLVSKDPIPTGNGHTFTVYKVVPNPGGSAQATSVATIDTVSTVATEDKPIDASMSANGQAFAIRTGDSVLFWNRTPGTSVEDTMNAAPSGTCGSPFNAPKWNTISGNNEEAFGFKQGLPGQAVWTGFVWSHDANSSTPPLYQALKA